MNLPTNPKKIIITPKLSFWKKKKERKFVKNLARLWPQLKLYASRLVKRLRLRLLNKYNKHAYYQKSRLKIQHMQAAFKLMATKKKLRFINAVPYRKLDDLEKLRSRALFINTASKYQIKKTFAVFSARKKLQKLY